MTASKYLRRKEAADFLKLKYGLGTARTLAKLATVGGGPAMTYFGRIPLYSEETLDAWAVGRLDKPVYNTSEKRAELQSRHGETSIADAQGRVTRLRRSE